MFYDSDVCIPLHQIKKFCLGKKTVVYGAGADGKMIKNYHPDLKVDFFIDRDPKSTSEKVYDFETAIDIIKENMGEYIILIGSRHYREEMSRNLDAKGFVPGEDYYHVDYSYDKSVQRFVEHNLNVWKNNLYNNTEDELLMALVSSVDIMRLREIELFSTYYSNILASKKRCSIKGFVTDDLDCTTKVLPSVLEVYRSANLSEIISITLSSEQSAEVEKLYNKNVSNLKSFEDWNKIEVFGINFGISIMRSYLRYGELEFAPDNRGFRSTLKECLRWIVFWSDYFNTHSIKLVMLIDGLYHEGIINSIAHSRGIPVFYLVDKAFGMTEEPHNFGPCFSDLKNKFNSLSETEKKKGTKWGSEQLKLLTQDSKDAIIPYRGDDRINYPSVFSYKTRRLMLPKTSSLRVIICPHIFNEDSWRCGWQLFDNYFNWLNHIGDISRDTDYEWYIKLHPDENERGIRLIEQYVDKYHHIQILPTDISPYELVASGFSYAFTIAGSIGHEYPYIGINVINAGNNPHISFDFCMNPVTAEEFDLLVKDLPIISYEPNLEELYQFYFMAYNKESLYNYCDPRSIFEENKWFLRSDDSLKDCRNYFDDFLNYLDKEFHEQLINKIENSIKRLSTYN